MVSCALDNAKVKDKLRIGFPIQKVTIVCVAFGSFIFGTEIQTIHPDTRRFSLAPLLTKPQRFWAANFTSLCTA